MCACIPFMFVCLFACVYCAGDCGSGSVKVECCYAVTDAGQPWRTLVLPVLTQLTKIANRTCYFLSFSVLTNHISNDLSFIVVVVASFFADPLLLFPNVADCADKQARDWEFAHAVLRGQKIPRDHSQPQLARMSLDEIAKLSGKTQALVKLLRLFIQRGDKACFISLLFCCVVLTCFWRDCRFCCFPTVFACLIFCNTWWRCVSLRSNAWMAPHLCSVDIALCVLPMIATSLCCCLLSAAFLRFLIVCSFALLFSALQVEEFNSSTASCILLMSTKVGGLGLNLSAANVCVLFDPNWNPSHECASSSLRFIHSFTSVI